jgi:hypothetical protein
VGADSRNKYVWRRNCLCHVAELTVQAANAEAFATCTYCDSPASLPAGFTPASDCSRYADELLQGHPSVQLVITEAKVLGGTFGGFDFGVLLQPPAGSTEQRRLEVEVDGTQHFNKHMFDTTAEAQHAADARKDKAAWKEGRCLLRLHYQDSSKWKQQIDRAIALATLRTKYKFQHYTRSYGKTNRMQRA